MTPDRVARLVAEGESLAVEFKGEERSALNDRDLVETVVRSMKPIGKRSASRRATRSGSPV